MTIEQLRILVNQGNAYLMLYKETGENRYKREAYRLYKLVYDNVLIKEVA